MFHTDGMGFADTLIWNHAHIDTVHTQGSMDWKTHTEMYINICAHIDYLY